MKVLSNLENRVQVSLSKITKLTQKVGLYKEKYILTKLSPPGPLCYWCRTKYKNVYQRKTNIFSANCFAVVIFSSEKIASKYFLVRLTSLSLIGTAFGSALVFKSKQYILKSPLYSSISWQPKQIAYSLMFLVLVLLQRNPIECVIGK